MIDAAVQTPADGWVRSFPKLGMLCRVVPWDGKPPTLNFQIEQPSAQQLILWRSHMRVRSDGTTTAVIGHPIEDERIHRLLSAELHHFPKETCNVIVICVTHAPAGTPWWSALIQRWFQPSRNTRIGAVAIYRSALATGPTRVRQLWCVHKNPFARNSVPDKLIEALRALDDPQAQRRVSTTGLS